MGRGGHSDDEATPYDQSLEELEFMRGACAAAQRGDLRTLRDAVARRPHLLADDGVGGDSGYAPLHYAAREGHAACVSFLLEAGARVLLVHAIEADLPTSFLEAARTSVAARNLRAFPSKLLRVAEEAAAAAAALQDGDGSQAVDADLERRTKRAFEVIAGDELALRCSRASVLKHMVGDHERVRPSRRPELRCVRCKSGGHGAASKSRWRRRRPS